MNTLCIKAPLFSEARSYENHEADKILFLGSWGLDGCILQEALMADRTLPYTWPRPFMTSLNHVNSRRKVECADWWKSQYYIASQTLYVRMSLCPCVPISM